jgi:putative restriction endonuclease
MWRESDMGILPVFDFKVVKDDDRSFQTVTKYNDKVDERYSYDSKVPNHKNIAVGSMVVIRNKHFILGASVIEDLIITDGKKDIRYCPICGSYNLDSRKVKLPKFRCDQGHEFDEPRINWVDVKKITANYHSNFVSLEDLKLSVDVLKEFYIKFNPTNSINKLDSKILDKLPISNSFSVNASSLSPDDAEKRERGDIAKYLNSGRDERENLTMQIKARRGQQKFRNELRKRYGDKCIVTGCEILDILEAAHVNPYRGNNDNHPANGLLLRADIHTLFDLDLIGIEPGSFKIHVKERIRSDYAHLHLSKLLCSERQAPDQLALQVRWNKFISNRS